MDIAALEACVETDTYMMYVKIQHAMSRHVNNVIPDCVYIIKNSSSVDSGHCAYLKGPYTDQTKNYIWCI